MLNVSVIYRELSVILYLSDAKVINVTGGSVDFKTQHLITPVILLARPPVRGWGESGCITPTLGGSWLLCARVLPSMLLLCSP